MSDSVKIEVSDDDAKIMALALIANATIARQNLKSHGAVMSQEFFDSSMSAVLHAYDIAERIGAAAGFDCDELVSQANAVRDQMLATERVATVGAVPSSEEIH